ncbi:MAG: hypothetical protein LRY73_12075 [Bacillus sp. (in: Bacteria)]|nr:hypothetical protein [Bacillus sp. (in: firmicutes)]
MSQKKAILIAASTIFLLVIYMTYFSSAEDFGGPYGNDEDSIRQVIHSIDTHQHQSIELLEIIDIGDVRIAAFLSDGNPAYIRFYKNTYGDYLWNSSATMDQALSTFVVTLKGDDGGPILLLISNHHNPVAKVEVKVNRHKLEQELAVNEASVNWFDLGEVEANYMRFDYTFFDEEGNVIDDLDL